MKGIEKITEKILYDAKQEASAVIQAAQVEADTIIKKYEIEAKIEKEKIMKNAQEKGKNIDKYGADMAQLEGRQEILRTKQEVLDIIFEEAFSNLKALDQEHYIAFLAKMAAEASLEGNDAVILSEPDKNSFGKEIIEKANDLLRLTGKKTALSLSEETRDIKGGLILKTGDIETNCTYEVLFKTVRNELAVDVAGLLF